MAKYHVSWPVEKTREVIVEADSEEEALARAQDSESWSEEEENSYSETRLLCKERWKRARAMLAEEYTQLRNEVYARVAERMGRKVKGRTK